MQKCPKCGKMVEGKETFMSDVREGSKYMLKGASLAAGQLDKLPKNNPIGAVSGLTAKLISFGFNAAAEMVPDCKTKKYKCKCGYSWTDKS